MICISGALILTFYRGTQLTHHPHSHAAGNNVNAMNSPQRPKNWALGSVLLAAGCLMWSSWFLMQARIGKSFPFQYSSTAILSFFGVIQSAILSLIFERDLSVWVLRGKLEIISVVYAVTIHDFFSIQFFYYFRVKKLEFKTFFFFPECFDAGNGGIWLVLCRNVMVCQTQGSSLHISIHSLHTALCSDFRLLHLS